MPKFVIAIVIFVFTVSVFFSLVRKEEISKDRFVTTDLKTRSGDKIPASTPSKIHVTTFMPTINTNGLSISFALATDLPNDTNIIIGVNRSYTTNQSDNKYPISYYSTKTTVAETRELKSITLDHEKWKKELEETKALFIKAGEPFEIEKVSDEVKVSFTIPIGQKNPAFGKFNENLFGNLVEDNGKMKSIRTEYRLSIPLPKQSTLPYKLSPTKRTKIFEEILSAWSPIKVEEGEGIFHVNLPHSKITNTIYQSVVKHGVCLELNYSETTLSGIDKIVLTNKNKSSGYIFKGGQSECEDINAGETSIIKNNMTTCATDCLE